MKNDTMIPKVVLISFGPLDSAGINLLHSNLVKNYFKVYSISLFYLNNKEKDRITEFVHKNKPLIVGISVDSQSLIRTVDLTKKLKEISDSFILWGGPHPTIDPEECLKYADGICIGDGEKLIVELAKRINAKKSLRGIKNLWFRSKNRIIKNETGDVVKDLNSLPFPYIFNDYKWKLVNNIFYKKLPFHFLKNYQFISPVMTTRHCPYSCSYCMNSLMNECRKPQKPKQAKYLIEELKRKINESDILYVTFEDDIFPMDDYFLNHFIKLYKEEIDLPFFIHLHPKNANFKKLKLLKEIGLDTCGSGIQTASAKIKQIYNRQSKNKDFVKLYKILTKLKILVGNDVIIAPFEDINDIMKTAKLIFKIRKRTLFHFHKLLFYKNYPLTKFCLENNMITSDRIIGLDFTTGQLISDTDNLEIKQMKFYLVLKMSSLGLQPKKAKRIVLLFKDNEKLLKFLVKLFLFYENVSYIPNQLIRLMQKLINGDIRMKKKIIKMLFLSIKNYNGKKVSYGAMVNN